MGMGKGTRIRSGDRVQAMGLGAGRRTGVEKVTTCCYLLTAMLFLITDPNSTSVNWRRGETM